MKVKIQRPIAPNNAPALLYSKDGTIYKFLPMDKVLRKAMGTALKKFFECTIEQETLVLHKEVEDEDW